MLPERPRMRPGSPHPSSRTRLEALNDSRRRRQQKWPPFSCFAAVFACCGAATRGFDCVASLLPWPYSDFHPPQLTTHHLRRARTAAAPHCADDPYSNSPAATGGIACRWWSYAAALGGTGFSALPLLLADATTAVTTPLPPALAPPLPHLACTLSASPLLATVALPLQGCCAGRGQPPRGL